MKKKSDFLENSSDQTLKINHFVYWKNTNLTYFDCNQSYAQLLGFTSPTDLIGKTDKELGCDNDSQLGILIKDDEVVLTGISLNSNAILQKNGSAIKVLIKKSPTYNSVGKINGIFCDVTTTNNFSDIPVSPYDEDLTFYQIAVKFITSLYRKITGHVDKERLSREELAENTRYYLENIIASMPGNVYWLDKECVLLGGNDNLANMFGVKSRAELVGLTYEKMTELANWSERQGDTFRQAEIEVMNTGKPRFNVEEPPVIINGETRYYLSNKVPLLTKKGKVIGVVGISIDITAQKEAEAREKAAIQETAIAKANAAAEKETLEKQVALFKHLAATVAHELNTPLKGIQLGAEVLQEYLPSLLNAYQLAKNAKTIKADIPDIVFKRLDKTLQNIHKEVDYSFLFIEMLLNNIRGEKLEGSLYKKYHIAATIEKSLNRYPFQVNQQQMLHKEIAHDFVYKGNDDLLSHILFNLIKNALYYVAKAGKGEIFIWTEVKKEWNELHFKDTGYGISPHILPHIFEQFFSKTRHGTGIGLTYSKMVMQSFDGDIICQTQEGEYTEFILQFPKV